VQRCLSCRLARLDVNDAGIPQGKESETMPCNEMLHGDVSGS